METITERVAGLDVHKDTVVACVHVPGAGRRRESNSHEFSMTTVGLLALRDGLVAHQVGVRAGTTALLGGCKPSPCGADAVA